jgi:hypothetical protein|tara:strand:+ start:106 stop:276 length:171 start_codon:yes stop_codon:yes gene_type:complete
MLNNLVAQLDEAIDMAEKSSQQALQRKLLLIKNYTLGFTHALWGEDNVENKDSDSR